MQSSTMNPQDLNQNDVNSSDNSNRLPNASHRVRGWAPALWKVRWLSSIANDFAPTKSFSLTLLHLNCREETVSTCSCHDWDKIFSSFGCVFRGSPPFSSLNVSPTYTLVLTLAVNGWTKQETPSCGHTCLGLHWLDCLPILTHVMREWASYRHLQADSNFRLDKIASDLQMQKFKCHEKPELGSHHPPSFTWGSGRLILWLHFQLLSLWSISFFFLFFSFSPYWIILLRWLK